MSHSPGPWTVRGGADIMDAEGQPVALMQSYAVQVGDGLHCYENEADAALLDALARATATLACWDLDDEGVAAFRALLRKHGRTP